MIWRDAPNVKILDWRVGFTKKHYIKMVSSHSVNPV